MRRYELMLVIRPDVAGRRSQAVIDRTTRQIVAAGGQIVKVAPWGRRRLAYPIDRHREGSYHIILFEAPAEADRRAGAQPAHHRGGPPPPRDPRRATGQGLPVATAPRTTSRRRGARPPVGRRRGRGRGRRTRADRRVRERGGSGRHRLTGGPTMALCKVDDHRQPRARSRDALHAQRPAGDPVQRRGQPEHQEPADRRVGRGDRLVPRQRLGRPRRARGRAAAQGQQGLRRGPLQDPRVRRPATARSGRRSTITADNVVSLERAAARRRRQLRGAPVGGRARRRPAAPVAGRAGGESDRARPTTPTSTTFPSDD